LRIARFLLVLAGPASLAGCHRSAADKAAEAAPSADAVKQSLAGLKGQLGDLEAKFTALREQVEAVPQDLPGFRELRAKFYGIEEGRGVMDAKLSLLAGRLESASAEKRAELQQIAKEITDTYNDIRQIEQLHVALLHQVMAYERLAAREKQAAAEATPAPAPTPAKNPRSKSKAKD
jgi:hypothetical protein